MRRLPLLLCAALSVAAAGNEPDLRGPLGLRTQGSLRELFLDVTAADARALSSPELDLRWSLANTWNEPMVLQSYEGRLGQQLLDEQADALTFRLRLPWSMVSRGPPVFGRPLGERITTALEVRLTEHWGGWSDVPIEGWHSLTGAFNFDRNQFPRSQVHLVFRDDGGTAFDVQSARLAFGDVVLRNQVLVAEGGAPLWTGSPSRWGISVRWDLKLPTGLLSRLGGSGGFDTGAALLGSVELTSWLTAHALVSESFFSPLAAPTLLQPRTWHSGFDASLECALGATTLILEDRVLSSLFGAGWSRLPRNGDNGLLSSGLFADFRAHNQVTLALRRGPFSLWFSEDFTPGANAHSTFQYVWESNAPDVVIGLSYVAHL